MELLTVLTCRALHASSWQVQDKFNHFKNDLRIQPWKFVGNKILNISKFSYRHVRTSGMITTDFRHLKYNATFSLARFLVTMFPNCCRAGSQLILKLPEICRKHAWSADHVGKKFWNVQNFVPDKFSWLYAQVILKVLKLILNLSGWCMKCVTCQGKELW